MKRKEEFNGIYETISTDRMKKRYKYKADCGCVKEHELLLIQIMPKGDIFVPRTILFRYVTDFFTYGMQPIWDNKKTQKKIKNGKLFPKTGKHVKIKYRKITKTDYKQMLTAYLTFYKWIKEYVKEDDPLIKDIASTIHHLRYAHRGVFDHFSQNMHGASDVTAPDLEIASLTMNKKDYKKFSDNWFEEIKKQVNDRGKDELEGIICHKCELPMEPMKIDTQMAGGHGRMGTLHGRKCPKCGFVVYSPTNMKSYIENNGQHYFLFNNIEKLVGKNKSTFTPEIKRMMTERMAKRKDGDKYTVNLDERVDTVITDIRNRAKKGKMSKYFDTIDKFPDRPDLEKLKIRKVKGVRIPDKAVQAPGKTKLKKRQAKKKKK